MISYSMSTQKEYNDVDPLIVSFLTVIIVDSYGNLQAEILSFSDFLSTANDRYLGLIRNVGKCSSAHVANCLHFYSALIKCLGMRRFFCLFG